MIAQHDSIVRFPTRLCAITLGLTLATFGWVVWNAYASYRDADSYRSHDSRVEELRGVILRLDEVLTMSARMAAATSDSRWEKRYRQYEPELDAAIKETMALAPGDTAIAASAQTDVANAKLVAMENQAFALVRAGRGEDARAVLFAPAYEEQKTVYADGMTALLTDVRTRLDRNLRQTKQRALLSMAGSAVLFGLSMVAWVAVMGSLRRTQSELTRRVDDRTTALTQANQTLLAEISERREIQAELIKARDAALEATRLKAEFLANMSHEIRTPMNGVIGMTELALDTDLTVQQREYLGMVKGSAELLLTIVNDILDFSKIEAGRLTLDPSEFKLRDTVDDTMKTLALRAHEQGLELLCDIQGDVPDTLIADSGRLRQVLVNLVGNAIKFTEDGEVLVSVWTELRDANDAVLHVAVSDTGIGIPIEKQSTIFDAFSQADGSITRKFGGTGLGLTISSNLVRMMGGRIWVDSTEGRGTTFHFTLRVGVQATAASPDAVPPELAGLSVLVVDDNATNRRIFEKTLENWRMRPTLADSGAAALAAVRDAQDRGEPFRLVLLDVTMPGMDGFTVATRLMEDGSLTAPTIMMLTSSGEASDTARCRELGIAAYLVKPVRQAALCEAILTALGRPSRRRVLTTMAAARPQGPSLRILLAEDNVVNQRVAIGLLEKAGHTVTLAENGKQALAAVDAATFDLVLMDMQMPEMSGAEATTAIRERERVHAGHLPIIALTAHALKGDRERCLAAGADGYVPKPVVPADLFREIDTVVPRGSAVPAWTEPTIAFAEGDLLARVGGSQALLQEVVELFLEDGPRLLNAIRAGLAAGDAAAVYKTAHTLKGSAGNFGAQHVIAVAQRLEARAREGDLPTAANVFATLEAEVDRLIGELAVTCERARCTS